VTVALVAFKLAGNFAVIPAWSYRGSAAMTTLTEALGLGLLWWRARAAGLLDAGGRRVESGR
jgi:hypothetical protein